MKKFLFLLVVVITLAVLFFLAAYYVFDMEKKRAIEWTIVSAVAGTLGSFIGNYIEKRKKNRITER